MALHLPGDDVHLAVAFYRPGEPVPTEDDDEWVSASSEVLDSALDGSWSLHLAAGGRVEFLVEAPTSFVRTGWATARGAEDGGFRACGRQ
jgi:hypothetical protein